MPPDNTTISYELDPLNRVTEATDLTSGTYVGESGENGVEQIYDTQVPKFDTQYYSSFSGSDILATFMAPGMTESVTFAQLRAISYSIVRDKRPLRILGSMNPVSWSRSTRLVAGTLIFTSFDRYVWTQLLGASTYVLTADLFPAFDIVVTGVNEYGQSSRLTIKGVRIVDEGSVIGVDDMYIEQTHTFVAQDVIPWIPNNAQTSDVGTSDVKKNNYIQ